MSQENFTIIGQVDAIYFENPSNFYKVARIKLDQDQSQTLDRPEIVVTGQFVTLHYETTYEFHGKLVNHPKYGEQFSCQRYNQVTPTSSDGLIDYLSSYRFKGIGPSTAENIVNVLGLDAVDKIIDNPDVLDGIEGVTQKRKDSLYQGLLAHRGAERVIVQLNEWGFTANLADKIYQAYGDEAIAKIRQNPYDLVTDVEGISFRRADRLGEELGIDALDSRRLIAGIYTAVAEICNNTGDTYVEVEIAMQAAMKYLETTRYYLIDEGLLEEAIDEAVGQGNLYRQGTKLMIPSLYNAELGAAKEVFNFMYSKKDAYEYAPDTIEEGIELAIEKTGVDYDMSQREALHLAIQSPISIITGGPGTGKTTLLKGIIHLHAYLNDYSIDELSNNPDKNPVKLAAPTGRAAQRMSDTTGLPASTIHRLIGFSRDTLDSDGFIPEKIKGQLLIIDEMSMVDVWLMNWLMQAVTAGLQIVLVGDSDQLPSVSPGNVFNDLIESEIIPTVRLTKIYRQADGSSIVDLAHSMRQGYLPENFLDKQHDRSFIQADESQIQAVVWQVVQHGLNSGYDEMSMQVLAPMYNGPAGVNAMNQMLQQLINPPRQGVRQVQQFDGVFRVGDKVLQLVNNTEEGVYNGDIGRIVSIYHANETESKTDELLVRFDEDKELLYTRNNFKDLTLAYCTTVHKAQGSEYPLVILPLVDMYSPLLRRDLIYTAITRASDKLVMCGRPQSFYKAVTQHQPPRKTMLKKYLVRLQEAYEDNLAVLGDKKPDESSDETSQATSEEDVLLEQTSLDLASAVKENDGCESFEADQTEQEDPLSPDGNQKSSDPILTPDNFLTIDPMIGMEGITPYSFMG